MKYIVKGTNIKHNGKIHKAGSEIELDNIKGLEKFLTPAYEESVTEGEEKKKKGGNRI